MAHEGHRQRIRDRFLKEGLDGFADKYVLELLLCYGLPQKDTKTLAEALLDHFGGLTQVLDASVDQLKKVPGVGVNLAAYLVFIREFVRRYNIAKSHTGKPLNNSNEYCKYIRSYFDGKRNEEVYLLCLDAKFKPICCEKISEGSIHSATISVRKIAEVAINVNATTVILSHNHPGGLAFPSGEDIATTQHIAKALANLDVILADHVVVAGDESISMVDSGVFDPHRYADF